MSILHSGENHWNYGNLNNKTSDIILQFDLDFNFIKEWPSMREIERELGYSTSNISRCCSNKIDTYNVILLNASKHLKNNGKLFVENNDKLFI